MLQTGFARVDITPPLGITVSGYFATRYADGVRDPLYATAVAFDDGEKRTVVMSLDLIGFNQSLMDEYRPEIARTIGTDAEGVFIACTHTHLGPCTANARGVRENPEYIQWLGKRLCDAATLAVKDMAPTKMLYTRGEAKDVAFIRRFRMKDGSVRTNPGWQNPDIDHALGTPDENSSLLILKRENKPEIGIVNFQVHPDVIGGCSLSADFPKFVRDTYEKMIDNSLCMYLNGAQGDTNHIDVRRSGGPEAHGYLRAKYMGKKIALSVIANYELAEELSGEKVAYAQKNITVKYNKGRPDQVEESIRISDIYKREGIEAAVPGESGMRRTEIVAEATRIVELMSLPDEKVLYITAVSVGDVAFAGFPGEPFTEIGRQVKANSKFTLTMTACAANGYEGYYPMAQVYDEGGYEFNSARYVKGTAEKLIEESISLINSL